MITLIFLMAGKSKRFGKNKLFMPLNGAPLFLRGLKTLASMMQINACQPKPALGGRRMEILIIAQQDDIAKIQKILPELDSGQEKIQKIKAIISGGKTRQESVFKALRFIEKQKSKPQILIIHNAANPFATSKETVLALKKLASNQKLSGVAVGRPVINTIKQRTNHLITLDRKNLYEVETPQIVRYKPFLEVHKKAVKEKFTATDDIGLLEWEGYQTDLSPASENNFKITTPRDFMPTFKFGYGEDSHAFSKTQKGLYLGGLFFKNYPKLEANSDGDVVLHAVCAGLLQALSEGSFGEFATPLFSKHKIRDSRKYVKLVLRKIRSQNLEIQKINIVIEGSQPKIDSIAFKMRKSLASILGISKDAVAISAHTGENLTSFGKGEGLRCVAATCLF